METGQFYFAGNRTFLNCVDKLVFRAVKSSCLRVSFYLDVANSHPIENVHEIGHKMKAD